MTQAVVASYNDIATIKNVEDDFFYVFRFSKPINRVITQLTVFLG